MNPETLKNLRLPELQAKFAEIVGETTRCPNKKFLIRRITETLAEQAESEPEPEPEPELEQEQEQIEVIIDERPLAQLDVGELRVRYEAIIGRPTNSSNAAYLRWKIGQARRGRVPVGARQPAAQCQVVPVRMECENVIALDEARERMGLSSRVALIRAALAAYLKDHGEEAVAARFASANP